MKRLTFFVAVLACCFVVPSVRSDDGPIPVNLPTRTEPVSYARDVLGFLETKCFGCHSSALAENKLNMEEVGGLLRGGKTGPALVPGDADKSLIFTMSAHRVEPFMPPAKKKDAAPLTPDELGLLKRWIDAGAKDDSSENPVPEKAIALGTLPPGVHPINAVDMTGDGMRVAAGRANLVQLYDVQTGLEILSLGGLSDLVQSVRFSPDGSRLVAGGYQMVKNWSCAQLHEQKTFNGHADSVRALTVSADGTLVMSGSTDRTIRVWNVELGTELRKIEHPSAPVVSLAVSTDGLLLAAGGADGVARLFNLGDGTLRSEFKGHTGTVEGLLFFDGNRRLASVSADGSARLWILPVNPADPPSDPVVLTGHQGPLHGIAVSKDGQTLITAGDDGNARLWSALDGKFIREIVVGRGPIHAIATQPGGDLLLTGHADGSATMIELGSGNPVRRLDTHRKPLRNVVFSADGSRLMTAGDDGVKVWESATGAGIVAFGHRPAKGQPLPSVRSTAFLPNGSIVTGSDDKTLRSWSIAGSWSEGPSFGPHLYRVLALDFRPDGKRLATGGGEPSRSGEIKIWDAEKGTLLNTFDSLHSDTVFGVRYSPDGQKLATAGADKFVKLINPEDGKELKSCEGHVGHVLAVDWKSDGKQIVSGGADNVLKIWDTETGELVRTLQGAGKQVTAVRWLVGKPLIAGASGDKTVRFWNSDNGGVARTFGGPNDYVFGLGISDDGTLLSAGGADGRLFVWNAENGQLFHTLEPAQSVPSER